MIERFVGYCRECRVGVLVEETALNGDTRVRCKRCQPLATQPAVKPLSIEEMLPVGWQPSPGFAAFLAARKSSAQG